MEQSTQQKPDFAFFNKFQTYFYTNIEAFEQFTNFEIKQNSFTLLHNLIKGYPVLGTDIMNVYAPGFIYFDSCPSLIKALQRKFVNNFSRVRVPQHVYYKSLKPKTVKKPKTIKVSKDLVLFSEDIQFEIKSILQYDSKTYDMLKYSEKVQNIGMQLVAEFDKKELILLNKTKKTSTDINL